MIEKVGLICEGGGTKAAYTCGVLQCFLDEGIEFPYCVGISAGAEVLLAYVAKQKERLRITGVDSASQSKSIGLWPLLHEKGLFGINYVCDFIEEHAPLDFDTFYNGNTELEIGVYNLETNEIEYYSKKYIDKNMGLIKASCALFIINRPYKFLNSTYMDAGLVDMISIEQSIKRGNEKHVFISTKEEGYVRKPAPAWQIKAAKMFYPKNEQVVENLKQRHVNYEKQWNKVKELEAQGKALVLRPSADYGITRYTHDAPSLSRWLELGYEDTKNRIEEIKAFVGMK